MKNLARINKEEIEKYTFRPIAPEGKFEWLNTLNIDDVMKQYEKKYSDFEFLGTVPMDFDDLPVLGIKDHDFNKSIKNELMIFVILKSTHTFITPNCSKAFSGRLDFRAALHCEKNEDPMSLQIQFSPGPAF